MSYLSLAVPDSDPEQQRKNMSRCSHHREALFQKTCEVPGDSLVATHHHNVAHLQHTVQICRLAGSKPVGLVIIHTEHQSSLNFDLPT